MNTGKPIWQAPMVVSDRDPVMMGLVRRAEAFLRDLFGQVAGARPLAKLKDLELYLRSLPSQGPYFAAAIRELVEPPQYVPSVQVHVIGRRMNIDNLDTDRTAQEAEDEKEWLQEWREQAEPSVPSYWDLVAEAIRANQKA